MKYTEKKVKHNTGGGSVPKKGEVWWTDMMMFEGRTEGKGRPVVVVSCDGQTAYIRVCTTQGSGMKSRTELIFPLYAGLDDKTSYVIDEVKPIPRKNLTRKLGVLCDEDKELLNIV